jgi:hypothetical protein
MSRPRPAQAAPREDRGAAPAPSEPEMADYCAACGGKAPDPSGEAFDGRLAELQSLGWVALPSRKLYGELERGAPHKCLCPACLATPTLFALQLLSVWGLERGANPAELAWRRTQARRAPGAGSRPA